MSQAGVDLVPPEPSLATIQLPAEFDQLLRRRETVSGAPPTGDLFTEDAIIQELQEGRWQRGRDRIDSFLGFMERNLHYVPSAYALDGNAGWIAGTVRQGTSTEETLNFLLGLKRTAGKWQIASEIFTVIPPRPYGKPVLADQLVAELWRVDRRLARIVLDSVLPSAPDVPIQIAHLGSAGGQPDEATNVFANAIAAKDPRTRNLYFDITQTVLTDDSQKPEELQRIADGLRRIGLERIFFGTDMTLPGAGNNPPPREHWKAVRKLPLTDVELRVIASNVPQYLR